MLFFHEQMKLFWCRNYCSFLGKGITSFFIQTKLQNFIFSKWLSKLGYFPVRKGFSPPATHSERKWGALTQLPPVGVQGQDTLLLRSHRLWHLLPESSLTPTSRIPSCGSPLHLYPPQVQVLLGDLGGLNRKQFFKKCFSSIIWMVSLHP